MEVCQGSHASCNAAPKPFSPTRLIDIHSEVPRLRIDIELQKPAPYATLSHCWGSLDFLKLTKDKLPQFRNGIPLSSLTRTFREAIEISKYLGIGYIWIDSLCIIQDSEEDWKWESALMADVYGQCTVNIAATAATDGNDGCFFNRDKTWRRQLSYDHQEYDLFAESDLFPTKNSLAERAWVLQERYLSPSTVHFGDRQVYFECGVFAACEIFPAGYREPNTTSAFQRPKRSATRKDWSDIVYEYSRCQLTKSQDKLVALGGLAKLVQESTPHRYLCGMWEEDLIAQLEWHTLPWSATGLPTHKRIVPYVAPTWSWASINGKIMSLWAEKTGRKRFIAIHDIQISYASPDVFGAVTAGRLVIRCELLHYGTIAFKQGPIRKNIGTFDINSQISRCVFCLDDNYAEDRNVSYSAYLMSIHKGTGLIDPYYVTGLVLESTGRQGEYRRLGFFRLESTADEEELFLGSTLARPDTLQHFTSVLKDADGKEEYFIELI